MSRPDLLDAQLGIHSLRLRSQRLDLIASNIANAATPGYKARDLDFAQALAGQQDALRYRIPVQASLDGNTGEFATEQTELSRNSLDYRASRSFLTGRIQAIMAAFKGGK